MKRPTVLACLCAALATGAFGRAQSPPAQAVFRTHAENVSVNVSVTDGNKPVSGLALSDFQLWDNGVRQKIELLSVEAIPIDVTLVIDTSGSTAGELDQFKADLRKIVAMLRPDDRVRLLTMDTYVHQVFPMQSVGTAPPIDQLPSGISSVYDGVLLAILRGIEPGRRHLAVAFTDGLDTRSATTSASVRDVARRSDCVLHIVLVNAPPGSRLEAPMPPFQHSDHVGFGRLSEAADATGGALHHAPLFHDPVVNAFKDAFEEFRRSYLLRFSPTDVKTEGWHDLRVELTKSHGYTIRARKGYFGG